MNTNSNLNHNYSRGDIDNIEHNLEVLRFPADLDGVEQIVSFYNRLHADGEYSLANELMIFYSNRFPDDSIINEFLARSYHFVRDSEAEAAAWWAAYSGARRPDFAACAVRAWLRGKQYREIEHALSNLRAEHGDNVDVVSSIAEYYEERGEREKATACWEIALRCDNVDLNCYLRYASSLVELAGARGSEAPLKKAEIVVWEGIKLFPDRYELLETAIRVGQRLGSSLALEGMNRLIAHAASPEYAFSPNSSEFIAICRQKSWLLFNNDDIDGLERFFSYIEENKGIYAYSDRAFHLEMLTNLAIRRREWDRAINYATTFDKSFPHYDFGRWALCKALLASRRFLEAGFHIARYEADQSAPEIRKNEIASLSSILLSMLPAKEPETTRIVLDITGLGKSLAAGANVGGIERTVAETALAVMEECSGNVTLVNWKLLPVEVSEADLRRALFQPEADRINPFLQKDIVAGEREYIPHCQDVVIVLGSVWQYDTANSIMRSCKAKGARILLFVHDLLQVYYPTITTERGAGIFRRWVHSALDLADVVLANSDHTRAEIARYRAEASQKPLTVHKVALGADFRSLRSRKGGRKSYDALEAIFAEGRKSGYVLYVSSIFKRKNHGFLVRAWDRLRSTIPGICPMLVIVGARGDAMDLLDEAMLETNCGGGRVVVLHDVTDNELLQLYENCLLTVFPSRCEGWGLPIAESFAHGKVCICSNVTSLPEVGGDLADYFVADRESEFIELIRSYILDPEKRRRREELIRSSYIPIRWQDTAAGIIDHVNATLKPHQQLKMGRHLPDRKVDGVIMVCPSWERRCGIARYSAHVQSALLAAGREVHVVRGIADCVRLIETGRFKYLIVQHEYGFYDGINNDLMGPDSTDVLLTTMGMYAEHYPELRQAIIMHTIDMRRVDFRPQTSAILASSIPLISLNSQATLHTRALFMEHGTDGPPEDNEVVERLARSLDGSIKVSYFGFLSPMKRVDKFLETCASVNATVNANFASNSEKDIAETEALIRQLGVKGEITFDFLSDEDVKKTLKKGDVVYLPQSRVTYWATTGSARVSLNSERPVITSPEDQFLDIAEAAIFATESTFASVLQRLRQPEYYAAVVSRGNRFRAANELSCVYNGLFRELDAGVSRKSPASGAVNIEDFIAVPAPDRVLAVYETLFARGPSDEEVVSFDGTCRSAKGGVVDAIIAVAAQAMREGYAADVRLDSGFARNCDDADQSAFWSIDRDVLVSAADLLQLDGVAFFNEAWFALGKRKAPIGAVQASMTLDQKLDVLRSIRRDVNFGRGFVGPQGQRSTHIHLRAPIPGAIQFSRRAYRLSYFAGFDPDFRALAVFRALLKREPSAEESWALGAMSVSRYIDAVRELAHASPYVELENDIEDVSVWRSRYAAIREYLHSVSDIDASELTGDNLALLEIQRISRQTL